MCNLNQCDRYVKILKLSSLFSEVKIRLRSLYSDKKFNYYLEFV